jgi:hypothetical protein
VGKFIETLSSFRHTNIHSFSPCLDFRVLPFPSPSLKGVGGSQKGENKKAEKEFEWGEGSITGKNG